MMKAQDVQHEVDEIMALIELNKEFPGTLVVGVDMGAGDDETVIRCMLCGSEFRFQGTPVEYCSHECFMQRHR